MRKHFNLLAFFLFLIVFGRAQLVKPISKVVDTSVKALATPVLANPSTTASSSVPTDINFNNWNFEFGLSGWRQEGNAFQTQPTFGQNVTAQRIFSFMEYANGGVGGDYWKGIAVNPGYSGTYWIGTYENNPRGNQPQQIQGDGPTGILTSPDFTITSNYCYFNIGGGADPQRLYVELQLKQADGSFKSIVQKSNFRYSELMYRERIDLSALKGQIARIRIVDNSSAAWGHINVDNFRFVNAILPAIELTDLATNRRYEVDVDFPVWGVADTHAHFANYDGFGGKVLAGKPNTPLEVTFSKEVCAQAHTGLGALQIPSLFIFFGDNHENNGWPDFKSFPSFKNKTHQQQHVEFLKRAWQGGMRLISALAINNMYVPSLNLGPSSDGRPWDDESAVKRQIQLLTEIASQNSQWMEIARTSTDARRIILQGKLAIVLGIEADNLGNFKSQEYNWDDSKYPGNRPLVTLTEVNAESLLENKLNEYWSDGVRQITPIHYISGLFGGAAVFRGELAAIQMAFNNRLYVKSEVDKKIPFSLYNDYNFTLYLSNQMLKEDAFRNRITVTFGEGNLGMINGIRMTSIGVRLINKMMSKGFLIDSEHMGYDTKSDLFSLASQRNYPIMSSHTDPAGISNNWKFQPVAFRNGDAPNDLQFNQNNFGTTNIRNLANEFQMADVHYAQIARSGGTVGVFMLPYLKNAYTGPLGSIANDCAGSTKTFAQMYLYSIEKMNYKGVGLATDRGMTDFIGPRFGPNAGYTLKDEKLLPLKQDLRRVQRLSQRNGVRYDVKMRTYFPELYENKDELFFSPLSGLEEDVWKAFAANEAGFNRNQISGGREVLKADRVKNFLEGIQISGIDNPLIKTADYFEKAAMFCFIKQQNLSSLPGFDTWFEMDRKYIQDVFSTIVSVSNTWNARNGNNQPLRRYRTGNRDWDFNLDGMAHYGMMPDFFQDLKNIGLGPDKLWFLFQSAEEYIKMWERAENAAKTK